MKRLIFVIVFLLFISSCAKSSTTGSVKKDMNIQKIILKTSDGLSLSANFYNAGSDKGVILLHQLGRDKSTYDSFAKKLVQNNISAIAIDLRGHGQSQGNLASFSQKDFDNMRLDVASALDFLKSNKINKVYLVGASIGANTVINFGATDSSIKGVVALSPGLDYRGIKTQDSAKKIKIPILIIVSRQDSYAFDSSNTLYAIITSDKQIKVYNGAEHGTDMFLSTDMDKVMIKWILDHK